MNSTSKKPFQVFLSCEHASNAVPASLEKYFSSKEARELLQTHRGFDIGAADVLAFLEKELSPAFVQKGSLTRLSIDLNRNSNRHSRYSKFTENATKAEKNELEVYFSKYREAMLQELDSTFKASNKATAVHLSIHSFTNKLNESERNADLGILYDPARTGEVKFAKEWKQRINKANPQIRVRFNYPYLGKTDGHATALRKRYSKNYIGFEVEMNQDWLNKANKESVAKLLASTLPLNNL